MNWANAIGKIVLTDLLATNLHFERKHTICEAQKSKAQENEYNIFVYSITYEEHWAVSSFGELE